MATRSTFGPLRRDWQKPEPPGSCPDCGGQCSPECGVHPAGCIYGGWTEASAYWLVSEGCELSHGEEAPCVTKAPSA